MTDQVGDMRKSIYAAIDNISQIAQQGGNRCFGAAVQSLVDFFSVYQGHTTFRGLLEYCLRTIDLLE